MSYDSDPREETRSQVPYFHARVDKLRSHLQPGPDYRRDVRDLVASALHGWDAETIGVRLVVAEIAAGLRLAGDFPVRYERAVWSAPPSEE